MIGQLVTQVEHSESAARADLESAISSLDEINRTIRHEFQDIVRPLANRLATAETQSNTTSTRVRDMERALRDQATRQYNLEFRSEELSHNIRELTHTGPLNTQAIRTLTDRIEALERRFPVLQGTFSGTPVV